MAELSAEFSYFMSPSSYSNRLGDIDEVSRRRGRPVMRFFSLLAKLMLGLALILMGVHLLLPAWQSYQALGKDLSAVEARHRATAAELAREREKIEWLRNDREYLEIQARDRLDLKDYGETIIRLREPR